MIERRADQRPDETGNEPVLGFDYPQDAEAVELQERIRAEGEPSALAHYAGIPEDHPLVDLVASK
jgi:mannitol-1-phosphate 5-dehydrogenase